MYALRKFAVSHAKAYDNLYQYLERTLLWINPLLIKLGYKHVEKPITFIEKHIKGLLFDCQMCGKCALHDTGMACPMNCPKQLRNGPCGGVRANGHCEVNPEMRCVWMEAWRGNKNLGTANNTFSVNNLLPPVDHRLKGSSSWLREVRIKSNQEKHNELH